MFKNDDSASTKQQISARMMLTWAGDKIPKMLKTDDSDSTRRPVAAAAMLQNRKAMNVHNAQK